MAAEMTETTASGRPTPEGDVAPAPPQPAPARLTDGDADRSASNDDALDRLRERPHPFG
jgi:hypothetical protein